MATQSYRERMKAARAEARARRLAAEAAWRRRVQLHAEVRRLALEATKLAIRDREDKVHRYSHGELVRQAREMIALGWWCKPGPTSLNETQNI